MSNLIWVSKPSFDLIEGEDKSISIKCYGEIQHNSYSRTFDEVVSIIEDSYLNHKFPALFYQINFAFNAWIQEKESEVV